MQFRRGKGVVVLMCEAPQILLLRAMFHEPVNNPLDAQDFFVSYLSKAHSEEWPCVSESVDCMQQDERNESLRSRVERQSYPM
ncbi:hypothetical protein AQ610_05705 [Burkholderia humptydooensis]|nr:hypothetical protein AQ610_05705 [Burkholderia humptydooensis]